VQNVGNVIGASAQNVVGTVENVGVSAGQEATGIFNSALQSSQVALGDATNKAKGWFSSISFPNWFSSNNNNNNPVTNPTGGSRRKRKAPRKTQKKKPRGGSGYKNLDAANFPSAANAQGNNIYNLGSFNPSNPFHGGKTKRHRKK